jgi:hypothetical protein
MSAEEKISAAAGQDSTRAFSIRVVIGLVVVGVLSFAAFIVLSAFADDLRKPEDGGPHAQSKSAIGFAALVDLLQGEGLRARVSRGSLRELQGVSQLVVLTPRPGERLKSEQIHSSYGDVLIVLPKWDTWPNFRKPGWVYSSGLENPEYIEGLFRDIRGDDDFRVSIGQAPGAASLTLLRKGVANADIAAGRIERLQTLSSADIEPVLTDVDGHTVLGRLRTEYSYGADDDTAHFVEEDEVEPDPLAPDAAEPHSSAPPEAEPEPEPEETPWAPGDTSERSIFVLADPDLLNTKGLASAETAQAAIRILQLVAPQDDPEFVFDMTLHGMERSRNFMKLLLEPPFLPAVLCLGFAGVLMAVYSAAGRVRVKSAREIALGKSTLVENTALLISLAGRDRRMGKRYVAMTRALAASAVGVPVRAAEDHQTALLDAVGRTEGEKKYSQLADDVASATTSSNMLKAANRLFRWRQEIGRERRRR